MATYLVTAIGGPFQKHNDILGHREHKDTEKNTLQVARSTRRRRAAGEACQPQTNDHWTVARSFGCGRRASRRGLPCRPPASSAFSVSLCLSVSVACPNRYVSVITKCCTKASQA